MTAPKGQDFASFSADLRGPAAAAEWRGNWAMALLYRRPGIALAWVFAQCGLRPSAVTLIALALALTMPLQAWLGPMWFAPWSVALTGMLFQILDCSDGTLARATGQASARGGDMDFLVDMAQWALLYVSIGILADRVMETGHAWTALAAGAAWARLMARVVRDRLGSHADEAPAPVGGPVGLASLILGGISGLLPFLALAGAGLPWAVGFLLLYGLLDIAEGLAPLLRE
ncbi:hypothetical protein AIOL_002354 [Candidatus Rhodobacter oscarellae]|uniref:CDP-diacylglycerol--glycerol-3-phosphate 3-phosphatidyltransferase n=1 Tax=Candidatus Rhodobacter oscarellae TaxID=1675527 RepID=A0A0J9E3J5_9RHOB|nr:CDP-alcohol phosphatidyltransferase family protein [Candidatus Rhodobacter lobularis]KMW57391.1 hypothetical protein AIOL_002354 [Candidatus Rhodobacter lobularis]